MKQFIFIILVSLCSFSLTHAQRLLISYNETSRRDMEKPKVTNSSIMNLEICGKESIYFSQETRDCSTLCDSLRQLGENPSEHPMVIEKYGSFEACNLQLAKNYPHMGMYTHSDYIMSTLFYEENLPKIEWKIESEERFILGYKCNKARGFALGRYWTVWYTEEIPLSEGPWILHGLPGLILAAEDDDKIWSLEAVGIEKSLNKEVSIINKGTRCSHKDFLRMRKEHDEDPSSALRRHFGFTNSSTNFRFRTYNSDGSYTELDCMPPIHKHYYEAE